MPFRLQRRYGFGHLHFITCSCYQRRPLLGAARARNRFVEILGQVRDRYGFALVGYVVMPEHVHLLISEPKRGTPSTVLQVLKQRVSRALRNKKSRPRPRTGTSKEPPSVQLALAFHKSHAALPRFWQRRFYDFNVWSRKKKIEKLNYMHMNPVKRKLVTRPQDWPWSSFSFYQRGDVGLVQIDRS